MFAELLARTCFSFLRGASHPEDFVERAHEHGLSALTIVDLDGLYGVVRGHRRHRELARGESHVPRYHIGAELSLAGPRPSPNERGSRQDEYGSLTVGLLVQSAEGYSNLCRLLSRAHDGHEKGQPACDIDELEAYGAGLFALLIPPARPAAIDPETTARLSAVLSRAFPQRVAVAIYRHKDGLDRARAHWARTQAAQGSWPLVATARPSYHVAEHKPLSDVLHCVRRGITLDQAGDELDGSSERYLRSEAQMRALFRDHPEWVDESVRISETLNFDLAELKYRFPCELAEGQSADERLRELTMAGANRLFPQGLPDNLVRQVEKELLLIAKIEVAPYFLSTQGIVQIARDKGILCQGRGSAANSAVCYLLGITAVDPSKSNLLFERFLSEERAEPPDIDVDFEHERREEVIQAIYERYGRERAAMVSEIVSYRRKSAIREVGKVFGLSLEQIERLSGTMTFWSNSETQERALETAGFDSSDLRLRQIVALSSQLVGFPRHLSIHVGGFVLSAEPLYAVAPIEPARKQNRTVVPWDKDDIDTLGFFKVDVLGLGMLTAIRKALALIHASGGLRKSLCDEEEFNPLDVIQRVPSEDPLTYDAICRAETIGVFQIESRAQMSMLPRLKPRQFYDLVIQVAIVRPGPIQGGMVHPFLRRRGGEEKATPPHPKLAKILSRTLGVPLFQEQVMQIAIEGAGYSGGQADQLRRDMAAWKKHGRLLAHRPRLLAGFAKSGIPAAFAESLFEQIKGFGEYGFPESHASSFAHLVYVSSWQKTHYPAHFSCALLNSQPLGFYAPTTLVREAQRQGVEVRDVSVSVSDWDCTLEPASDLDRIQSQGVGARAAMRLGLRIVRGLGQDAAARVVAARRLRAFDSLEDFRRRTELKKNELDALAESGALEALTPGRTNALWQSAAPRTPGLFQELDSSEVAVTLPELRPSQQLVLDYARKGLSVGDHPLRYYRRRLQKKGAVRASDLQYLPGGKLIGTAGLVLNRQRPGTASGVVFMTLEDETGIVNLIVQSHVFEKYEHVARHSALLWISGILERDKKVPMRAPGEPTDPQAVPVIHVLVQHMERLQTAVGARVVEAREPADSPQQSLHRLSRNFH